MVTLIGFIVLLAITLFSLVMVGRRADKIKPYSKGEESYGEQGNFGRASRKAAGDDLHPLGNGSMQVLHGNQ